MTCHRLRPTAPSVAFFVLAPILLAGGPGAARADEAHAIERYRAAEEAYAHGAYRAAAETFEAAFHEDPRAASIYNAGVSWETAGDGPRAADDYAAALAASDLRSEERADASKRVTALEAKLGRIDATGPVDARITVAHVERGALPAHVHLAPGRYTVRVTYADGHVETRDARVVVGGVVSLDLTPGPASEQAANPEPSSPPSSAAASPRSPEAPSGPSPLRTAGWVAVGGAAVLVVAAAALGEAALNARSTFDATGDTSQADHDQAVALRTWTNVAWVAAGVAGITGAVLVLVPVSPHGGVKASAFVGPNGVGIRGSF
jgi:tetratricopeptide (TPR) repeat protein